MMAPLDIAQSLVGLGFAERAQGVAFEPLAGGVSSDIWKVSGPGMAPVCVKRARARLAVAADWQVPVERNHFEAEFLRVADSEVPGFAPALLAEDTDLGFLVLDYLPPDRWRLWKAELMAGRVDLAVAERAGAHLGALAAKTRGRPDLAARFATDGLFDALRLDPYLRECSRNHADLAPALDRIIATTAGTREALVHGDVSPKNILVGEDGTPIILDAECAWYGDPAFDLAFLLNHLVVKAIHLPHVRGELVAAARAVVAGRAAADGGPQGEAVSARAAALLPGLMLARVDGKSPVEYLDEGGRRRVRETARRFIEEPPRELSEVFAAVEGATA